MERNRAIHEERTARYAHSERVTVDRETDSLLFYQPQRLDSTPVPPNPIARGTAALRLRYETVKNTLSETQRSVVAGWLADCGERDVSKAFYYLNLPPNYILERCFDPSGFDEVVGRVKEKKRLISIFKRCETASVRGCRILLIGPHGCGVSTLIKSAERALQLPFYEIDASVLGAADSNGMTALYAYASPALLIQKSAQTGCTENGIVIRNIDMISMEGEKDGNPFVTIRNFMYDTVHSDRYLDQLPVSFRNARIIATATTRAAVPVSLMKCFDAVIELKPYSKRELREIAGPMISRLCAGYGKQSVRFPRNAVEYIVSRYSDNARSLETNLRAVIEAARDGETVKGPMVDAILRGRVDDNDPAMLLYRNRDCFTDEMKEKFYELQAVIENPRSHTRERECAAEKLRLLTQLGKPKKALRSRDEFFRTLDMSHYGMTRAKTIISDFYAAGSPDVVMLVSPYPGVGKTSLAEAAARAADTSLIRVDLNCITAAAELFGDEKEPSPVTVQLAKADSSTVVILFDEADKFSGQNLLLDLVEKKRYKDKYLNLDVPLDNALIIFTGNDVSGISPYLLDRCTVIPVEPYTDSQKKIIVQRYIVPALEEEYGAIRVSERAVRALLDRCTAAGLREVKATLKMIVLHLSQNDSDRICVSEADVKSLTKAVCSRGNLVPGEADPGVVKGLAVSGSGEGMAFSVECVEVESDRELTILGLADEDVKESAMRALVHLKSLGCQTKSYVLSYAEGSVRKTGSSAGAATALALYSAVSGIAVPPHIAVTGELSLKGYIYPVGGVEQKLDGARRAGCTTVFIPQENYDNMEASGFDFGACGVRVIPVTRFREVIAFLTAEKTKQTCFGSIDLSKGA